MSIVNQSNNVIKELKESIEDLDITKHFWTPLYQGYILLHRVDTYKTDPRLSIQFVPENWQKGEHKAFLDGASNLLDDIIARRGKKDTPLDNIPKDLVD